MWKVCRDVGTEIKQKEVIPKARNQQPAWGLPALSSNLPTENLDQARTECPRPGQNWVWCLCLLYSKALVWFLLTQANTMIMCGEWSRQQRPATKMILLFWGVFLAGSRGAEQWGESCVPSLAECLTLLRSVLWLVCLSLFLTTLLGFSVCADRTSIVTHKHIPII